MPGLTKPKQVEECVQALLSNPDFKPLKGKTREESAYAICYAKYNERKEKANKMKEEDKMTEEDVKQNEVEVPNKEEKEEQTSETSVEEKSTDKITEKLLQKIEALEKKLSEVSKEKEEKSLDRRAKLKQIAENTIIKQEVPVITKEKTDLFEMLCLSHGRKDLIFK